ncbi:glycosyltransferase family protein [Amylibacter sp.]|nr:glycosyltransferase family protein [Amylibacter sp.]
MKTVAILQARMASTRLPGKVLFVCQGQTILSWVTNAVRSTYGVDEVCVAIPDGIANEQIVAEAKKLDARIVRGSEKDVLARFAKAANETNADNIMRVTSDCPYSDPKLNAQLLEIFVKKQADYACNNEPFSFPHGLDCEIFTKEMLHKANIDANEQYDREHVTPWIKRKKNIKKCYLLSNIQKVEKIRLTVDYEEDFLLLQKISDYLGNDLNDHQKVLKLLRSHPEMLEINKNRLQR